MCLFVKLSKFISIPILMEWIGLDEYGVLNSALCNNDARPKFLELIRQYSDKFKLVWSLNKLYLPCTHAITSWFKHNGLTFDRLLLNCTELERLNCTELDSSCFDILRCRPKDVENTELSLSLSVFDKIKQVRLSNCTSINNLQTLKNILLKLNNSQEITVVASRVDHQALFSPVGVQQLSTFYCKITSIELGGFHAELVVCEIVRLCPALRELTLECQMTSSRLMLSLTVHCRQLTSFVAKNFCVRYAAQFHIFCLHVSNSAVLTRLLVGETPLSSLSLRTLFNYRGRALVTLEVLMIPPKHKFDDITDADIPSSLVNIKMPRGLLVGTPALVKSSHLESFSVFEADKTVIEIMEAVLLRQSKLKTFGLKYGSKLDPCTLLADSCKHLQILHLVNSTINVAKLLVVVQQCSGLTDLDFSQSYTKIDLIKDIFQFTPNLTRLTLQACYDLTDACLIEVGTHCKRLKHLDIGNNKKLTSTALLPILLNKRIKYLNLNCCVVKLVDIIDAVAQLGSQLNYFNCSFCVVTEDDLTKIVTSCVSLKVFGFYLADTTACNRIVQIGTKINSDLYFDI